MQFIWEMIRLGLGNLRRHKMRSVLTALGIILGIAAVIAMVSIGEGKKRAALAQLERLGAKNIIIRSQRPPESQEAQGQQRGRSIRYGLTRADLAVLEENFRGGGVDMAGRAESVVPLKEVGSQLLRSNLRRTSQTFGTTPDLLGVAKLTVARGRYLSEADLTERAMVAVIGSEVARAMFPFEDPLENTIRIDSKAVKVVGILAPVGLSGGAGAALVGRDLNQDVHIPITTAATAFGDQVFRRTSGQFSAAQVEVAEIYLTAPTRETVTSYAGLAKRIIETRHPEMTDVTMIVPFELLRTAEQEQRQWNMVLGTIAGVSLLVGGIGIMNIMLASVTERTREIGIRRALGATKKAITAQFLVETGVLSSVGGMIGVVLGVSASILIGLFVANMPTHLTAWSILLSFAVAAATGLVFGLYPAMKAARQDPIVALRHD